MDCNVDRGAAADKAAVEPGGALPSMEEAAEQGEVQKGKDGVVLCATKPAAKVADRLRRGLGLPVRDVPILVAGVHHYLVLTSPSYYPVFSLPAPSAQVKASNEDLTLVRTIGIGSNRVADARWLGGRAGTFRDGGTEPAEVLARGPLV